MMEADDGVLAQLMGEGGGAQAQLRMPASGLLDTREECSGDMAFLRRLTGEVRRRTNPCAWAFVKDREVMCLFFFVEPLNRDGEAILSGSVAPDYQDRGHGIRLYRRFIRHLEDTTAVTALRVQIFASNRRSRRVHEFLGFQPVEGGSDPELGAFTWFRLRLLRRTDR